MLVAVLCSTQASIYHGAVHGGYTQGYLYTRVKGIVMARTDDARYAELQIGTYSRSPHVNVPFIRVDVVQQTPVRLCSDNKNCILS